MKTEHLILVEIKYDEGGYAVKQFVAELGQEENGDLTNVVNLAGKQFPELLSDEVYSFHVTAVAKNATQSEILNLIKEKEDRLASARQLVELRHRSMEWLMDIHQVVGEQIWRMMKYINKK